MSIHHWISKNLVESCTFYVFILILIDGVNVNLFCYPSKTEMKEYKAHQVYFGSASSSLCSSELSWLRVLFMTDVPDPHHIYVRLVLEQAALPGQYLSQKVPDERNLPQLIIPSEMWKARGSLWATGLPLWSIWALYNCILLLTYIGKATAIASQT